LRVRLIEHAKSYVGIKELTGRNDGPEIERFQRVVGIPLHSAYCAAFVSTIFFDLNIPAPVTGWAPSMVKTNIIYEKKDWRKNIMFPPGSVFGNYFPNKGRVAHVGFIQFSDRDREMTIQANTSMEGSVDLNDMWDETQRDGDGIARKWIPLESIYVVSDYIGGKLEMYDWRKSGGYVKTKFIEK